MFVLSLFISYIGLSVAQEPQPSPHPSPTGPEEIVETLGKAGSAAANAARAIDTAWTLAMRSQNVADYANFLKEQFPDFESSERAKLRKLDQECNQMEEKKVGSGRTLIRKKIIKATKQRAFWSAVLSYASKSEENNERVLKADINTSDAASYLALDYFEVAVLRYYSHFRFEDFALNDWFAYYDLFTSRHENYLAHIIEHKMDTGISSASDILKPHWDKALDDIEADVLQLPPKTPHPLFEKALKEFSENDKKSDASESSEK